MTGRILIVDDDPSMCQMLETALAGAGFSTRSSTSPDQALAGFDAAETDVVITDLRMRGMTGVELCTQISQSCPEIPVIVVTAFGSMETAIAALRAGAYDFITKPFDLETIRHTVGRAVERRALQQKVETLENTLTEMSSAGGMLGASVPMDRLSDLIHRVAISESTVLITGESGSGKELVARALHGNSQRRDGPFVAINCAALPESLLESELFGHMKGAFTDARTDRPGLFQQADGGTLFLDEIGELPLGLQPKLLRALQEQRVRPLGGQQERSFDARLIAATNRDLEAAVAEGKFREDLLFRIQVIEVPVPPLRVRGDDILLLAQSFAEHFARRDGKPSIAITPAAADKLLRYPWPGNVRELRNCIERAVTLCRGPTVTADDLSERVRSHRGTALEVPDSPAQLLSMDEVERRHVLRVFEATGRNKSETARILGYNRKTLYRKLERYGLAPDAPLATDD